MTVTFSCSDFFFSRDSLSVETCIGVYRKATVEGFLEDWISRSLTETVFRGTLRAITTAYINAMELFEASQPWNVHDDPARPWKGDVKIEKLGQGEAKEGWRNDEREDG